MHIYFELNCDSETVQSEQEVLNNEFVAVRQIGELLGKKVYNEGHDSYGALVCYICVEKDEVTQVRQVVADNTGGGDDIVYLDNDFSAAQFVVIDRPGLDKGESLVDWGE